MTNFSIALLEGLWKGRHDPDLRVWLRSHVKYMKARKARENRREVR
jgi:hypothetical protein